MTKCDWERIAGKVSQFSDISWRGIGEEGLRSIRQPSSTCHLPKARI